MSFEDEFWSATGTKKKKKGVASNGGSPSSITSSKEDDFNRLFWSEMEEFQKEIEENKIKRDAEEEKEETRRKLQSMMGYDPEEEEEDEKTRKALEALTKNDKLSFKKGNDDDRTWFQKGATEEGVSFDSVMKGITSTADDVRSDLMQGILGIGEKTVDAGATLIGGIGKLFGADEFSEDVQGFIKKDIIDEEKIAFNLLNVSTPLATKRYGTVENLEESSFLGDKSDSLVQSAGQLLATRGMQKYIPWWVTSGTTSFGGEAENAFNQGAGYGEAVVSSAFSAGFEIATEKLFGGSGLGEKGLINTQALTKGVSNKAAKILLDFGIDIAGEGFEEVAAEFGSILGRQLTYEREETLEELFTNEEAMDKYLHQLADNLFGEKAREAYGEAAIGGMVLGGGANVVKAGGSLKNKTDYHTGLNANEEAVVNREVEKRIEQAEKDGKKLSKSDKSKIQEEVMSDLDKGYISTDTIEEVLGGDTYKSYQDTVKSEDSLVEQEKTMRDEFNTLNRMKKSDMTGEQSDRLEELRTQLSDLTTKIEDTKKTSERDFLQRKYRSEAAEIAKGSRLEETYRERARRGQKFEADVSKYKGVAKKSIESIIEKGQMNNSNKAHDLIDLSVNLAAARGKTVTTTTTEEILKKAEAKYGKQYVLDNFYKEVTDENGKKKLVLKAIPNAELDGDTIALNVDSPNLTMTIIGHELGHTFEGTKYYNEVADLLNSYDKTVKGNEAYEAQKAATEGRYQNIAGANAQYELNNDLLGEYIFSDEGFVKHLTQNRNVFQKIYDQIKYMVKYATAGSQQEKDLLRIKHTFEKAWREAEKAQGATKTDVKHSISEIDEATVQADTQKAVERFGTTSKFEQTGYVLADGRMLNMTRDYNVYHDQISEIFSDVSGREAVNRFVQEGNVRLVPVSSGIEIGETPLSTNQLNVVSRFVGNSLRSKGYFFIDITGKDGKNIASFEYDSDSTASDVIYDIKQYYERGRIPSKKVWYSLSEDTSGRKLTAEQKEFFKDSKVVDENGNLKVMYHGTSEGGHTVFDTYGSHYGLFGTGSYFTDSKDIAEGYTKKGKGNNPQVYESYLNITNPIDMDAQADAEAWQNAFPDASFPESGTNEQFYRAMEEYFEDNEYSRGEASEMAMEALEGMGYDGITHIGGGRVNANGANHQVYIAFHPEQIKDIGNAKPTGDPDIRYSLTETEAQETNDTLKTVGLELDSESGTVSYSLSSLEDAFDYNKGKAEYIAARDEYVNALAKSIAEDKGNPTQEEIDKANRYLDGLFLVHDMIAADKDRLDYEAAVDKSAWVSNAEYGGSIDFSTLCAKRRLFTGTFDAIQEALPDTVLNENDFLRIRNMLLEKELESPCSMCYVEGSRAKHGEYVAKFLQDYLATNPEWKPQIADFTSSTRLEQTRINHPEAYQAYQTAMNKLAQRKPKEASVRTDYKGEILVAFEDGSSVEIKNKNGGIRFNSFSDFEIIHALDAMQVITDMARVGLNGQAYTKVKEFAECFGNTGLKINLSLVAKDVDANGKLIYDEVNGMKYAEAMDIRNRYSENVGSVIVVFNEDQLKAALADPEIDYVLPFHRSQWKKSQYAMMGLPVKTKDYTQVQNDRIRNPNTGRPVKLSKIKHTTTYTNDITGETFEIKDNIMPNQYWDFSKNGRENAQRYLDYINANGMTPKFDSVLEKMDGKWVLPEGAIGDGYYKLLIDFKMYDNDGWGAPQNPVVPEFNMPYIQQMLNDYTGGHKAFPVAHDVVDEFVEGKKSGKFSLSDADAEFAPTGYNVPLRDLRLETLPENTYDPSMEAPMQEDVAPVETEQDMFNDEYAPITDNSYMLSQELKSVEAEMQEIMKKGDTEENLKAFKELVDKRTELRAKIAEAEKAEAQAQSDSLDSITDADAPPEVEAPYYGDTLDDTITDIDPFESRDMREVSKDRKVKAYMYENPEVKPFFQEEANYLLGELERVEKPQVINNYKIKSEMSYEAAQDIPDIYRTSRVASESIVYLRDSLGMSYADIEKGLKAIIEDNGAENIAAAKKLEFHINDRLLYGYELEGLAVPPNEAYKKLLEQKQIIEYNEDARRSLFENADQYAPPDDMGPVMESAQEAAPTVEEAEDMGPVAEEYEAITPPKKAKPKKSKKENKLVRADNVSPEHKQIAQVLDAEPETTTRKSRAWAKFKANFLDKGAVFEDLALKTKNRELMGKWNYMLYSEARAQRLMGSGAEGVKSLNSIIEEVGKTGKTKEFYEYLYHQHNVDRMSLVDKADAEIAPYIRTFWGYTTDEIAALARKRVTQNTSEKDADLIHQAKEYVRLREITNKPVFGDSVTAQVSRDAVAQYEKANPEFKQLAQDVYDYNNYLRKLLVDGGVITQETADLWSETYPHYVPIRRDGKSGNAIGVPLDTGRTSVNAPVKKATGGNSDILPLFDTMAMRTAQTFKAIAKNSFGVELKNSLGTVVESEATGVDDVIDNIDQQDGLLKKGENGGNPTFTVFENGEKVTYEITEDMYDALKPTSEGLAYTNKVLNTASNLHRGVLTEYNPIFMLTNAIKDIQDIFINSQHAWKTYAKIPEAFAQLVKKGYWYLEYMANGGEQNTYFDNDTNTFKTENTGIKRLLDLPPLSTISKLNNFIEMAPRLAEYIASREAGRSVEVSMLDAARVTTNFRAGGDITKFLNRNGATFLNASVQGAMQQVRNVREAKANGMKGWVNLATKFALAGLPALLLNGLVWDDDEEYEELSDYVKQNYYIVGKYGDGNFIRIPKGRAMAVIQNAFEQVSNALTGDDEVDLKAFLELAVSNLAPNNPLENNILSPITQVANNKTWYGEDLVPTRLQDLPAAEQFDESTDAVSKWLGEKLNISPYKINYLLNQYTGGVGDTLLPMITPEAESGDNSLLGNFLAPLKSKFTTDSVMNNQNVSDFYDKMDELTTNAKSSAATDEDVLMNKYMNAVNSELSDLYAKKREIQNSNLPDGAKYAQVREIQEQIVGLTKNGLNSYEMVDIKGEYATVGDVYFKRNKDGEWVKLDADEEAKYKATSAAGDAPYATDGTNHYRWYVKEGETEGEWRKITDKELEKQNKVTSGLGISASDYWADKDEYDYAYEYPEKYTVAKAVGGYDAWKSYSSDLYDIKADKDADGKTISGSRKDKVLDYVNGLNADYGEKIIIFKSEYPSDDTYNYEIIDYLNSRDDISYDEMNTILKELGFTVNGNNITWD